MSLRSRIAFSHSCTTSPLIHRSQVIRCSISCSVGSCRKNRRKRSLPELNSTGPSNSSSGVANEGERGERRRGGWTRVELLLAVLMKRVSYDRLRIEDADVAAEDVARNHCYAVHIELLPHALQRSAVRWLPVRVGLPMHFIRCTRFQHTEHR